MCKMMKETLVLFFNYPLHWCFTFFFLSLDHLEIILILLLEDGFV